MARTKYEYKVKDKKPGKYHFNGFGVVDLRNVTDKEAQALIDKGFPYLEKVKVENKKTT